MLKPKIVIADDHKVMAEALASLLSSNFEITSIVHDGFALVDAIQEHLPDVVVADIEMPRFTGLDALRQIKKEAVKARFIFLTMHAEPAVVRSAIDSGAAGYLLKESAGEELVTAIREVLRGHIYISPSVTKGLLDSIQNLKSTDDKLTPRQRQVLRLVAEGQSMKEIADMLKISTRTVETYKYEMMRTLGVKNTAELIRYAMQHP